MAGLKEIRRRITSVKNTKQITRAMKLVSAAKLRRAQEAAVNGRAFSESLEQLLAESVAQLPEADRKEIFGERAAIKRRLFVVIAADRGLCGAYNTNVVKAVQAGINASAVPVSCLLMGRKAVSAARRYGWTVAGEFDSFPEDLALWPIDEVATKVFAEFQSGEYDEVMLCYTKFITTMTLEPTVERLLPLVQTKGDVLAGQAHGPKFSPSPKQIVETLIPLFVTSKVRQGTVDAKASEHAARMTAMDSATNNANDLIERLKLFYNRARQTAITRELIDIVGGAEAIK